MRKNPELLIGEGPKRRGVAECNGVRPQREQGSLRQRIFHSFCTLRTLREQAFLCPPLIRQIPNSGRKPCVHEEVGVDRGFASRQIAGLVAGGLRRAPPRPYVRALRPSAFLGASALPEPLNAPLDTARFSPTRGERPLRPHSPLPKTPDAQTVSASRSG